MKKSDSSDEKEANLDGLVAEESDSLLGRGDRHPGEQWNTEIH